MTPLTLSKSQYLRGVRCHKALWLNRHRPDLREEPDTNTAARLRAGTAIGQLAERFFDGKGIKITQAYWEIQKAQAQTEEFLRQGYDLIFEATAIHPQSGCHARIDILRSIDQGAQFDLIEVKSATRAKNYHIHDLAFQRYVFEGAGYNIRYCCLLLVNTSYVYKETLDPKAFFRLKNVTERVSEQQDTVGQTVPNLIDSLQEPQELERPIGQHCFSPFQCDFFHHCWKDTPDYSVYDVFQRDQAEQLAETYGLQLEVLPKIEALPPELHPSRIKRIDMQSYLNKEKNVDGDAIKNFLEKLQEPLYFLDYEAAMPVIPLFKGTRPFQKIPFQFSLHKKNTSLIHYEFLHLEKTDPRKALIEALLEVCGTKGSILVYYKGFESSIHNELARDFPCYKKALMNINERIVDLYEPFRQRWLYHPKQCGSASIKSVLPAFTDLDYSQLAISNGESAMLQYEDFITGNLDQAAQDQLCRNLLAYCKQDTYAMVELLEVLSEHCPQAS